VSFPELGRLSWPTWTIVELCVEKVGIKYLCRLGERNTPLHFSSTSAGTSFVSDIVSPILGTVCISRLQPAPCSAYKSKTGQHMDVNLLITTMDCAWNWHVKVLTSGGYAITSLKVLARNNQGSTQEWGAAILRGVFGRQEGRQACVHQVIFTSRSVVPVEVVHYARVREVSLCQILLVVATVACRFQRSGVGVSITTNSDRILACVDGNIISRSSELGRLIIIS